MNIVVQNKPHRIHEAFTELHHLQELQGGFVALKMDNLVRTCDAVKHAKEPTSKLDYFHFPFKSNSQNLIIPYPSTLDWIVYIKGIGIKRSFAICELSF